MKNEIIVADFGAPVNLSATLSKVSEEEVWLADFDSARSRETYRKAVQQFMGFLGAERVEELRNVSSGTLSLLNAR